MGGMYAKSTLGSSRWWKLPERKKSAPLYQITPKKMAANNTPLEEEEQAALVEWLELKKLKFTSIPNATFS